jgi:hypothetical protein
MSSLGREIRICPARRPGIVFAFVSLVLGAAGTALTVALHAGAGTSTASDRTFVGVIAAIFMGLGLLLLVLGHRKRKRALVYRVFEAGLVRETSTTRDELRFSDVGRLLVRALRINNGPPGYTICLVAGDGRRMELPSHSIDNVDESLVALFSQLTRLKPEPLTGQAR